MVLKSTKGLRLERLLTLRVDPLSIQVGESSLVADVLQGLRGFRVHEARGAPPPP